MGIKNKEFVQMIGMKIICVNKKQKNLFKREGWKNKLD